VSYNPIVLAFLASLGGAALGAGGVYLALDRTPAPSAVPAAETAAPPAPAPPPPQQGDAQRALEGVQKQEFLTLQAISEKVRMRFPGEVVGAKLSEDDGVLQYELKVLTTDGRILEIAADPKSGAILDIEEDDD
jgi:Peptidase propeptide and YPEB domain